MDRYTNQPTATMPHSNGTQVTVVLRKPFFPGNQPYTTYTVSAADYPWTLADRFFKECLDWWMIADMNPHVTCPDDLYYGLKLLIPVV